MTKESLQEQGWVFTKVPRKEYVEVCGTLFNKLDVVGSTGVIKTADLSTASLESTMKKLYSLADTFNKRKEKAK